MPTTTEILDGLTTIANDAVAVAVGWHVVVALALVALLLGWRPRPRTVGLLISLLPASVASIALAYGNPFNGIVFAVLTIVLVALSFRDRSARFAPQPAWTRWGGGLMIAYGWFYPHFLIGNPLHYLYAAPVGLVPCPTLAIALGFALLARGGGTRAWPLTLAGGAAFYALFGVFRLGVALDLGLLVGAVLLGINARTPAAARPRPTPDSLAQA
jgi:hypothetical protein